MAGMCFMALELCWRDAREHVVQLGCQHTTIQTEVPVHFTSVLKKLVGVTQLYVRGLVMDRDDALSVEVTPTWRKPRCAGCGRRAPQYDHPRSVGR